jgi:hypothetical protein
MPQDSGQLTAPSSSPEPQKDPPKHHHKFRPILLLLIFVILIVFAQIGYKVAELTISNPEKQKAPRMLSNEEMVRAYTLQLVSKATELKAGGSRDQIVASMQTIADERQKALKELLHTDPGLFLQLVQPNGFADKIPSEVSSKTERQAKVSGKLTVEIGDPLDGLSGNNVHAKAEYNYSLVDSKGKKSKIYFDSEVDPKYYNQTVTAEGIQLGDEYAAQTAAITTTATTTSAAAPVVKRVAVILFNFKSNTAQPASKSAVSANYFGTSNSVNSYYLDTTFNQRGFTGDVYGYYTIDNTPTTCDYNAWSDAAKLKAQAANVDLSLYDHVSYAFPFVTACSWGGMGQVGGTTTWINGYPAQLFITAHEIGHNLGMTHAQATYCIDANKVIVAQSDNCTVYEYGDAFDVMGQTQGARHVAGFRKLYLGSIPATNIVTATTGEYTLAPIEKVTTEKQVVRIPKDYDSTGKVTTYYYIDFRQPSGYDSYLSTDNAVNGVMIKSGPEWTQSGRTQLLDATPGSPGGLGDAALTAGKEFYDAKRNIRITTKSVTTAGATIVVNGAAGTTCVRSQPSVTVQPTSQWGNPGTALNYVFSITNRDSASCGEAMHYLGLPGVPNFTLTASPTTVILQPGETKTVTLTVKASATIVGGSYPISINAISGAIQQSPVVVPITFNVYDQSVAPPAVIISKPISGTRLTSKSSLEATASAATGRSITRMELYVNNVLTTSVQNSTKLIYSLNSRKLKATGTVNLTVMAYDSQNAVSTATVTVTN